MKFLTPMDNQDIMSVVDVLSMSMLFYNDITIARILQSPAIIEELAASLVLVAKHNTVIKNTKELAVLAVNPEELVRKVERNGVVLGIVQGGKS